MEIDWEQCISEGVDALPEKFRAKIDNVAILLEDEPSAEVRRREQLSRNETLLGLYHGIPLSERGEYYGVGATLPDTITLYRNPILDEARHDPEQVKRVVAETVWHEFGHYFGLDEHEVRAREGGRGRSASTDIPRT
jgi:predicted Zn-dependent protease with MMP-like domain